MVNVRLYIFLPQFLKKIKKLGRVSQAKGTECAKIFACGGKLMNWVGGLGRLSSSLYVLSSEIWTSPENCLELLKEQFLIVVRPP